MNENERLNDLKKFQILDSQPEKEFDEIVKLAADIFQVPISLISFIDSDRLWFKAKFGIDLLETPRDLSFCNNIDTTDSQILVINDTLLDNRFKNNPFVDCENGIRFYAGAPLVSENGNLLGAFCIEDTEPRNLSEFELRTLKSLSNRVLELLLSRVAKIDQEMEIVSNDDLIEKISDHSPGALFKFQITNDGDMSFPFVSKGITLIHPGLTPEMLKNNAVLGFNTIHADDLPKVYESIGNSFKTLTNLDFEFRIAAEDGTIKWHRAKANPEKREDRVVWYGTLQDITESKEYIETLEEIMFSISHIIKRPVTTLMGLVQVLNEENISLEKINGLTGYFNKVASEMDEYTQKLNDVFLEKKVKATTKQFASL
ncbi:MAG: PAS domain-containing protein [bacterium]|nr:PAS domain-containing protein [bacterium]